MEYSILLLVLVASSTAEIFDRPCRTPEELGVKRDFSPKLYLGSWYEIERYEQAFQAGADCVKAQYTLNQDGSIHVLNSAFFIQNGTRIEARGTARLSFPNEQPLRAMLNVTFSPLQPNISNYWVLGTDYLHYAVVVSCFNLGPSRSLESFWVLSRQFKLTQEARTKADVIKAKFIDSSRVRITDQDNQRCGRSLNRGNIAESFADL